MDRIDDIIEYESFIKSKMDFINQLHEEHRKCDNENLNIDLDFMLVQYAFGTIVYSLTFCKSVLKTPNTFSECVSPEAIFDTLTTLPSYIRSNILGLLNCPWKDVNELIKCLNEGEQERAKFAEILGMYPYSDSFRKTTYFYNLLHKNDTILIALADDIKLDRLNQIKDFQKALFQEFENAIPENKDSEESLMFEQLSEKFYNSTNITERIFNGTFFCFFLFNYLDIAFALSSVECKALKNAFRHFNIFICFLGIMIKTDSHSFQNECLNEFFMSQYDLTKDGMRQFIYEEMNNHYPMLFNELKNSDGELSNLQMYMDNMGYHKVLHPNKSVVTEDSAFEGCISSTDFNKPNNNIENTFTNGNEIIHREKDPVWECIESQASVEKGSEAIDSKGNDRRDDSYRGCLRSSRPYDEDDIKTICDMVCRWFKDPTNFRYYFFGDVDYVEGKDLKLMHGAGIKMAYFIKVFYKGTLENGQVVVRKDMDSNIWDNIFKVIKDSKSLKTYNIKRLQPIKEEIDIVMKPVLKKLFDK